MKCKTNDHINLLNLSEHITKSDMIMPACQGNKSFKRTISSSQVQDLPDGKEPFQRCSLIGNMVLMSVYKYLIVLKVNSKELKKGEEKFITSVILNFFSRELLLSLHILEILVTISLMHYSINSLEILLISRIKKSSIMFKITCLKLSK